MKYIVIVSIETKEKWTKTALKDWILARLAKHTPMAPSFKIRVRSVDKD